MAASRTILGTFLIAGLLVVSAGVDARAPAPGAGAPSRLLVELAAGASAADVARDAGGSVLFSTHEGTHLVLTGADAAVLARDARVKTVEHDARVATVDGSVSPDRASWDRASWDSASADRASWDRASWDGGGAAPDNLSWALAAIHASDAWSRGVPVHNRLVCVPDSGVDSTDPLLADALWIGPDGYAGRDFLRGGAPDDVGGHGTHLAGILAASPGPYGVRGVGAPLVASARILGPDGTGATSDLVRALGWCGDIGANIVLLALSEDAPTQALRAAIHDAQARGMLVVASAGNAGPCDDCVSMPAAYPGVLAVGAIGPDGKLASFSSTGREVDLVAPGVRIASTAPGGGYVFGSGTSQAAAVAAGAAALVWGQAPTLSAKVVASTLVRTSQPTLGDHAPGLVDAGAASARAVRS